MVDSPFWRVLPLSTNRRIVGECRDSPSPLKGRNYQAVKQTDPIRLLQSQVLPHLALSLAPAYTSADQPVKS